MLSRSNLHAYQERGVEFVLSKRRCALFLDMGLGKTATTLTALSDLFDSFAIDRVLIIAPLRVANTVWKQEAARWEHLRHLNVTVATGTEKQRNAALMSGAEIVTINRENVPWLVERYSDRWPFDAVVIDESSSFKSSASKRFKALRKVLGKTHYMVLLTGTPSPNGLLDLWAQFYLIDGGMALGRTMTMYKQRFFESDYMGYKFTPAEGSDAKIQSLIAPMSLSMSAADYLELPERIDIVERVDLPAKVMAAYDDFERECLLELDDGNEIEALNAAVLAGKLLQFASGALYTDKLKSWTELHTAKLDALAELLEDCTEPVLVAYNFESDLERLTARFPQAVVLDASAETIERWNNGEIPLLLAHPQSAGHGLNLQRGGCLAVWFSLCWSLEYYQQFNARLHRQGQDKPVRIVHFVAQGTIDERVLRVLSDKASTQANLLESIKHRSSPQQSDER